MVTGKPNGNKTYLISSCMVLLITVFFLLIIISCRQKTPEIETFTIQRGDIIETVTASGTVDSAEKKNYSLIQSAKVLEILKKGDAFQKGQVLIRIDDSKILMYISQAEQNLVLAKKSIDIARINYQSALDANHVVVQIAESNKDLAEQNTINAFKALENANELGAANLNAAYNSIQSANNYVEKLKDTSLVTDAAIVQAEGNVTIAEGAYKQVKESSKSQSDAAEGAYEQALLNQSINYWNTINSLDVAAAQIKLIKKSIEQAETQLELSNINLEIVKLDLDNFKITAPFDGIVLESNFNAGEIAGPGISVISVISDDLIIKADVNETDILKISNEQEVELIFDAYPDNTFKGRIIGISPISKNTAGIITYEITVIPEKDTKKFVKHGFSANLTIITSKVENVLYAPAQAVYDENGKSYADVLTQEGNIKKVEVTTGMYNYDYIEIKSGLSEEDKIVISKL